MIPSVCCCACPSIGDQSGDSESEALRRLEASGARLAWISQVREVIDDGEAERAEAFGESLPVGLRLADG